MFARVPVDRVRDNPYQTRTVYGSIEELADSISKMASVRPETRGLIQVPPARIISDGTVLDPECYGGVEACLGDEPQAVVELAAGHRRLRAFAYLVGVGYEAYKFFPVEVQCLDDQAMADIAWEENVQRKDLSSIEEAEALQKAVAAFGWTQAQVGERWGLSQPAVANKLRLLQLPADAQDAIRAGQITEKHGRALLKALGKSERIYQQAALDVLPLPVDEKAAAVAREVVGKERIFNVMRSEDLDARRCVVCGGPVGYPQADLVPAFYAGKQGQAYLCLPCARAAQGWEVPTASGAEDLVERAIAQESKPLAARGANSDFPINKEIPGASYLVEDVAVQARINSAVCTECWLYEKVDRELWCRDKLCHHDKTELWFAWQSQQLALAVKERWPGEAIPPIVREWGKYDLADWSEADKAMVESGHCGPHCDRLRFRYSSNSGNIRLVPDLPFIYNCNNTNSHDACRRRYLKSLETEDQVAAVKMKEKVEREKREEARLFLARAEASVADAIREMHDGVWRDIAYRVLALRVEGAPAHASICEVAASLVQGKQEFQYVNWDADDAVAQAERRIRSRLEDLGVGLVLGMEEITIKLEKIKCFLLDDNGMPRAGLTPEQVTGNLANLDKLADLVRGMGSEHDTQVLLGWILDLRELFPGK